MAIHSFSWQVLSHPKMFDLVSPPEFEKKELTETKIDGVGSEVLFRETLRNVTIDDLQFKKVTPLTRFGRRVVGATVTGWIGLTIAPCGVLVNGVRTTAAFLECKWKKTGVEGDEKVKAFAKAFFCDLRATFLASSLVAISALAAVVAALIFSTPFLIPVASFVCVGLAFNSFCLDPLLFVPENKLVPSFLLREKLGLVAVGGSLLAPSEKNVIDCERVDGEGSLLEIYRGWYREANARLKKISSGEGNEKYVRIKEIIAGEMGIPVSDLRN